MCVVYTLDITFQPLKTTTMSQKYKYFVRKFRHPILLFICRINKNVKYPFISIGIYRNTLEILFDFLFGERRLVSDDISFGILFQSFIIKRFIAQMNLFIGFTFRVMSNSIELPAI